MSTNHHGTAFKIGQWYTYTHSVQNRRQHLIEDLADCGADVNLAVMRHLVTELKIPEQYLSNALVTAGHLLRGDLSSSAAHLARFWGRSQDYALGFLFDGDPARNVLRDSPALLEGSRKIAEQLSVKGNSFHAIVARATLAHHVARATGERLHLASPSDRQSALAYRSEMIGLIMLTNDVAVSLEYGREVARNRLLLLIEEWAFPTYSHDARMSTDFTVPRSILLTETSAEILRELRTYNDAYLHYLVTVYLPLAMKRDATFGLKSGELAVEIRRRMLGAPDQVVARACGEFLGGMQRRGINHR
jgi:hypothetical protein